MTDAVMTVEAAGGVVRREGEVLLVHRPKYDDWTFPKGKLEPGETHEEAAAREVEEETGLRCALGRELPSSRYHDRFGRPKLVRYWSMAPVDGEFVANREVDEVRWLSLEEAAALLTHDRDREILKAIVTG